jgi:hypothetical protein
VSVSKGRSNAAFVFGASKRDGGCALCQRYPTALLAQCTGAVFPVGLPERGSDCNDMHHAYGMAAVRACVVVVVQEYQQAMQTATSASKGNTTLAKKRRARAPVRAMAGTLLMAGMALVRGSDRPIEPVRSWGDLLSRL